MKLNKIFFLFFILISSALKAADTENIFVSANDLYSKGKYEEAVKLYENILKEGKESSSLYYNLGNAYFKTSHIGLAILNYERAKKLDPDDEDISANLKLANQKVEDKIEAAPSLFLEQLQSGITDQLNEKQWSLIMILLIIGGLLFFAVYVWSSGKALKQTGFFAGSALLIAACVTFFIAKSKYNHTVQSDSGVIISAAVTVTGSPTEKSTRLFLLHEGTKVKIMDESDDWTEIKIPNGNVGWVKTTDLQKI
jgi:tetratricopeptide (TPR) repeat protein